MGTLGTLGSKFCFFLKRMGTCARVSCVPGLNFCEAFWKCRAGQGKEIVGSHLFGVEEIEGQPAL
jgi:hypothetical protein